MSLNKEYVDFMSAGVKSLVDNGKYEKATNHVTFDASKLDLPETVTAESMKTHVGVINQLAAQAEVAVAEVARTQFAENDKLTTVDGTLDFGGFTINSQHHLKQQVGDDFLHGISTTAIDYAHSDEQAGWLQEQRDASTQLAAKLFG